jgi:menaquinone-specific isochorismate synthase
MTGYETATPIINSSSNSFRIDSSRSIKLDLDRNFKTNNNCQVVSFSQKIKPIDPLVFLQAMNLTNELHFYWENPSKQEAIAAYGTTKLINIESEKRFALSQKFIQESLQQIIQQGDGDAIGCEPRFFCSYTFFSDADRDTSQFSPATIFLPKYQIVRKHKSSILVVNTLLREGEKIQKCLDDLKQEIKSIEWSLKKVDRLIIDRNDNNINSEIEDDRGEEFKSTVKSVLRSIERNEYSKIVIAHAIDIISQKPFSLIESLHNLRQKHPDCYIFSTGNGKGAYFIGASPERLISIQNRQLVTDALAGSAPRGKGVSEDLKLANQLLKNRKEKREHQAVSDFICDRLKQLSLTPQQLPLQILQLSNIQHLWTPIYAHLPANLHPLEIVAHLHPTPAVAGVPSQVILDTIRHYEKFDRSLYAAPLGWVDDRGNAEFIVGIRSASIDRNRARLYAGAGIVSGSHPDKEFAEIQLKLQTLLKALRTVD